MEFLLTFSNEVASAPQIVWYVALILTFTTAWILHAYNENLLYTVVISTAMFISVLIGEAGFKHIGLLFSADRDSNVVASAGASICAVSAMAMILARLMFAVGDLRQKRRYRDDAV